MNKKLIVLLATVFSVSMTYACVYHIFQACGSQSLSGLDLCGATFSCTGTSTEQYDYVKGCRSGTYGFVMEPDFTCHYSCSGQSVGCYRANVTLNGTATQTQANMDYSSGICNNPSGPKCN